ncbi:hypothetical protein EUTSA_v10029353mg [Eutrema salsugineum]|uniref:Inhibitor I9 domain-containing protein n=1 Tax=Eutrema salsugineum TaxID=72664 RepID=V4LFI6_EUTSA|nr:uncharacterized protein LOC18014794 [Eutrema salsugineum]ESQ38503.1 hypothetical protein EUTSA_v10029353mg [Eutrema salsugineum]
MFSRTLLVFFAFSISIVCSSRTLAPSPDNSLTRLYLVQVDPAVYHDCKEYQQLLEKVLHERSPKGALIYCYEYVMSGFAAVLTEEEAEILKGEKGIFRVAEDTIFHLDVGSFKQPNH